MSISRESREVKVGTKAAFRSRRSKRISPCCEPLEHRQLLSVDGSVSSLSQSTASPNVDVMAALAAGPTGLTPQQIQDAYGVNLIAFSSGTVSGDGAGETIAIVDAYKDSSIASDLAVFDQHYGLMAPPSFTVDNLGATTTDAGWDLETALDVEWAHAIAPAANIILVEAASSSLSSLFNAVSFASEQTGVSVVSMSWGTNEFLGESNYDGLFTTPAGHTNVAYVAASGDTGAWYGPEYPSVSPNVLAVGGTTLSLSSGNSYGSETGWSDSTGGFSGLDSDFQSYESEPSYQTSTLQAAGLSDGVRTTPDVSFNADPNSGVSVYDSTPYDGQSGWFQLGGTSAAAPAWAGIVAIADQGLATGGKGPLNTTQVLTDLYSLPSSDFNDITSGFNGYSATTGYDLVTGLGSPKASLLVAGLLSANGVSEGSVQAAVASTTTTVTTSTAPTSTAPTSTAPTSTGHHHARHVRHTKAHRADLPSSSTDGPSSPSSTTSGSSTASGSSGSSTSSGDVPTSSTTSIAAAGVPATAALATPLPFPVPGIQIGAAQAASVSPGGTNANLASQSSAPTGSLGQGLQEPAKSHGLETGSGSEPAWLTEILETTPPLATSAEIPVLDPAATPDHAPALRPVLPGPSMSAPSWDDFDEALEEVSGGLPVRRAEPFQTQFVLLSLVSCQLLVVNRRRRAGRSSNNRLLPIG
jgi:hypothetical protein